ncbi:probable synaptic vesicle transporter SVOP and related transporters (major facilitator superfamily) [Phialocephala subalpina]|uniref:Probable synaptic vesicle transporter SVOP and related transporters (Major facilitator superfamily) n=1 Tax=Phialocephala subalpina TaxID=576137 RepID=A0A1L7WNF6_9HELO|nr:probable synaptic vesicle transporter SVOP and related transporters (major facilitator superfamily) [Phialocephala subalpina]
MATPNNNGVPGAHHEQEILDETLSQKNGLGSETSSTTKAENSDGSGKAEGIENVPQNGGHPHPHFGADRVISANKDTDAADLPNVEKAGTYDKIELTEEMCYDELGFAFPTWKKWTILTIIFLVQVSMNFNTSLYSNAIDGISAEFNVSAQAARCGAMIFLVLYAFGCELWAPWSEELGRKPILQLSLLLVNIWQLPVALAPNFASIMVGRALGGLSSAGGSVTLGMIADMWEADNQQYAVAFVVFSSVGGSILGPIVGGFSQAFLDWRWSIWIQLIFGGFVQILHFVLVPETRTTIMMDNIAKKRRKSGQDTNIWGPNELVPFSDRFSTKEIFITWSRPFKMFLTEPIVLTLSLLSGFSDALIFMFIQSFALVYKQWGFGPVELGLAFIPIGIGYFIAWLSFIPIIKRNIKERRDKPDDEKAQYESRLWWLLYTAPCLPIGLIGFAWTSTGPPIHWIGSMVFAAVVGIANYSIYMATIDYMICAYGPYSASATGGNGWSRDFLAGVLTIPATPFFTNIGGKNHLADASTILFCISFVLVIAVYVIYWKGPVLRKRSPFAQQLSDARAEQDTSGRRLSRLPTGSRANSFARSQQDLRMRQALGSRQNSHAGHRTPQRTPMGSRKNSHAAPKMQV